MIGGGPEESKLTTVTHNTDNWQLTAEVQKMLLAWSPPPNIAEPIPTSNLKYAVGALEGARNASSKQHSFASLCDGSH